MAHALQADPERQKKKKKKKNGESSPADEQLKMPPPPDGGWGWAVVFASFMIHVFTDGVTYSFGVIYTILRDYFGAGDAATSWIASILYGVTLCSGPLSSMLVNKYGCRAVTIAGAILSSLSLLASMFAQNIVTLYFTVGLGTGLGFGLIYLPAIVCVTIYFEKYRSFATGIAVCGSGVGTFVFAPVIKYLEKEFGWRGALLITSGLVLNCVFCGMLFRPIEPVAKRKDILLQVMSTPSDSVCVSQSTKINGFERPQSVTNVNHTENLFSNKDGNSDAIMRVTLSHPVLNHHHFSRNNHYRSLGTGIMNKMDIFYQRSVENVTLQRTTSLKSHENEFTRKLVRGSQRSLPNEIQLEEAPSDECICCNRETKTLLKQMLDLSLLLNPIFFVFVVSNFCTSVGFNVPYLHLIPLAEEKSTSIHDPSNLISVIGVANSVGRIILGWVSDRSWINRLLIYNLCLTVCGLATVFSTFCQSYVSFVVYACTFGFTIGAYVGLTSVILVDLLGLDRLTNAFGLLLLFQGVASLAGPPIAGKLRDVLASYNPGFLTAGAMIAISGIMLWIIPPLQRHQAKKSLST